MPEEMSYGEDYHYLPVTSLESGNGHVIRPDVYGYTVQIVNIAMIGQPGQKGWVLVDAGMPHSAQAILDAVAERFGENSRPEGIVLTHGHFDHVGAVIELVEQWRVPVYTHESELPYLTGKLAYDAPDPTVDGGLVAKMSMFFPSAPIQLGQHVHALPPDGSIPVLPDWRWIHTPGHTPGHISLFRDRDRVLIAGDAFVTVKQESVYKVFTQEKEISGPPKYFTPDWESARSSVAKLQALHPEAALTGHGLPMTGAELEEGLEALTGSFDEIAVPASGKYV